METFDKIWEFIDQKLLIKVPPYIKYVLKFCGYENGVSIATIENADIEYFVSQVKNGNVTNYYKPFIGDKDVLEGCNKTAEDFEFSRGHIKLLMYIVSFLKKHIEENGHDSFTTEISSESNCGIKKRKYETIHTSQKRIKHQSSRNFTENRELDVTILEGVLLSQTIMSMTTYVPELYVKLKIGCGLLNNRNNCFFNSLLQALFHLPTITNCIQKELKLIQKANCKEGGKCVVCAFVTLFKETQCSALPLPPYKLYTTLKQGNKRLLDLLDGKQQDPHEFFMLLTEELEQQKHSVSWFTDNFMVNIQTKIECSLCKRIYLSSGFLGDLALHINKHKSVQQALDAYFDSQSINEYKCSACKKKVSAKKRHSLESAPRCVVLQLRRFSTPNKKISKNIEITQTLNLSQYFSESQSSEWKYKLVGIINHSGKSLQSGHFKAITYTKNHVYEFNDSTVRELNTNVYEFSGSYVRELNTSLVKGNEAYLLFYELSEELNFEKKKEKQEESEEEDEGEEVLQKEKEDNIKISPDGEMEQYILGSSIPVAAWIDIETGGNDAEIDSLTPDLAQNINTVSEPDIINEIEQIAEKEGRNKIENNVSIECADKISGRRIVDMDFVFKQMQDMTKNICKKCEKGEMIFESEFKRGLMSIFKFRCTYCGQIIRVNSSQPSKTNSYAGVNESSVLGIVSVGLGFYHLQECLAHLNVPCMCYSTFHKIDQKLQNDWWQVAKKFENDALNEEIRLAKENNEVDSAGNKLIGVEIDGSWGKRSFGNNFSSLSGCAAIIGRRTNKIIYCNVKNKYCHVCKIAQSKNTPPNNHKCKANYDGPSSGMETQIIVEGFMSLAEKGVIINKFIGDGDSSTYKALRGLRLYKDVDSNLEKFECENHIYRNFTKKCNALPTCTKFKLSGRKLLPATIGRNICKGVRMAAKHWRQIDIDLVDKYSNLEKDIMNAPLHYIGVHENCAKYFCNKTTDPEAFRIISVLKETNLYYKIMDLCQHYFSNNAKSLIAGYSTNKTEGFNSLICKTLGHSGSTFHEITYGNTMTSCLKLENTRKRKVATNAIAKEIKSKKPKLDASVTKKKDKRKHYGAGREDVDMLESNYELAKNRFLEKLREDQFNRDNLEMETRAQQHSFKWMQIRQNLLTTSYFGRILNTKTRKSYTKIVEEIIYKNIRYSSTGESRHQAIHEKDALSIFSKFYKDEPISQCGIFIDAELCFLGASPFRLYGEDAIVIVKCPKDAFKKSMEDAINKKKNLIPFYTAPYEQRRVNFKSHWYFEIQGQLHITGRQMAYLVIYLGESIYEILELERDDSFWKKEMENELIFFFNEALLKELVDPRDDRNMDIREYNAKEETFV